MFSPDLETPRLHLRNMHEGHLDFVFRHFGDPDVYRHLVDEEPVTTIEQAREIVTDYADPERTRSNRWVLELRPDEAPIGELRGALLEFLASKLDDRTRTRTTVVFDARDPPPGRAAWRPLSPFSRRPRIQGRQVDSSG